ncbi:MAG: hypothetical protein NTZ44_01390 [Candidatus Nomurabacteria bacterium]|nr:hypothetical protein [Candidatus Nomurabacteria bacterium]
MSNKITLDNKDLEFNESFLPCLVIGADKSGASYFSVTLAGKLIQQGSKVIYFTAFPMAKEELLNQIGNERTFDVLNEIDIANIPEDKSIIVQSGNKDLWTKVIQGIKNINEYIIFVKNIEEYDNSIFEIIGENKKILLSGDLDNCIYKENLVQKEWVSKIIFTVPKIDLNINIPNLEKYESYLDSKDIKGVLRLVK